MSNYRAAQCKIRVKEWLGEPVEAFRKTRQLFCDYSVKVYLDD